MPAFFSLCLEFRHSQLSMTVPHYSPSPEITAEPGALEEGLPPKQSSNYIFRVGRARPKINEESPQRLCLRAGKRFIETQTADLLRACRRID